MQTTRPRSHGLLPRVVLAAFSLLVMTGFARAGDDKDNWFIVEMLGQRAGWMHDHNSHQSRKDHNHIQDATGLQPRQPPHQDSRQWRAALSRPPTASPSA